MHGPNCLSLKSSQLIGCGCGSGSGSGCGYPAASLNGSEGHFGDLLTSSGNSPEHGSTFHWDSVDAGRSSLSITCSYNNSEK